MTSDQSQLADLKSQRDQVLAERANLTAAARRLQAKIEASPRQIIGANLSLLRKLTRRIGLLRRIWAIIVAQSLREGKILRDNRTSLPIDVTLAKLCDARAVVV